jgi:luciferase family oxidoreductase group 1
MAIPLSVLDLAPIAEGLSPTEALAQVVTLAKHAEELGFKRYWVAEHHNMASIASASPAVLIGHIASATSRIRVGSGGVMLPNHASLVIAEQFALLEALHPGRIDLGLGRAPGTDQITAHALRRSGSANAEDFPQQVQEVIAYLEDRLDSRIRAVPVNESRAEVFLLGSSGFSAQLSALLGLPFSFANHFGSGGVDQAVQLYRDNFRPSEYLAEPYVLMPVNAIAAENLAEARKLALSGAHSFLNLRKGTPIKVQDPEKLATLEVSPVEQSFIDERLNSQFLGTGEQVAEQLTDLAKRTGADELMVTNQLFHLDHRIRSLDLINAAL